MKIRTKLLIIMISLITSSIVVTSLLVISNFATTIQSETEKGLKLLTINIMDRLSGQMFERLADIKLLSSSKLFNNPNITLVTKVDYLRQVEKTTKAYASISMYNTEGIKIADTRSLLLGTNESQKPFFQHAIQGEDYYDRVPVKSQSVGQFVIHFSEPLYDEQGKIKGVIVTRYSINKINDLFKQAEQDQQTHKRIYQIDLVSNQGIVIYSNYDPKSILKRNVTNLEIFKLLKNNSRVISPSSSSPPNNKNRVFSTIEDHFGRKNIFVGAQQGNGYLDYRGSGWFLILGANYQEVYASLQNLINQVLVSAGAILAIAIVTAFFFAEKISKPISRLKGLTQDVIKGQYDTKIESKSSDELGELASSFESMRKNVNEVNQNLNSLVAKRTMELQNANEDLHIKEFQLENANEGLLQRDKELQAVNEELRNTDLAKEEFISMVSHELKTPLGPAKGYIEMLLRPKIAGELNEKQKKYANTIYRNIQKLEILVSDVLDVYKLDMGKLKLSKSDIAVSDLLSFVQEDLRLLTLDKEINFVVQDRTNQGDSVFCDPKRIEQVLANLIKNSIDFVPERNGKIIVTVQEDPENHSNMRFSIEDNGIGIPVEKMDKLFNKFYQIDTTATRKHGGTGLGLSICRGIIETHGGKIWVDKGYVNGTRIIFTLLKENQKPDKEEGDDTNTS